MAPNQEHHDMGRQVCLYHSTWGLPGLGSHPSRKFAPIFYLFQKKEWTIGDGCVRIARITYFHSSGSFVFTKQKVNNTDYYYYYPESSGGSQTIKEGTSDANESEAMLTKGQMESASSSIRPTFCPNPRSSNSDFSSGKCDKAATNAGQAPQRTPLAATVSIQPSSSSATIERDAASEDSSSALPSTRF
jgi:hypothetical protein